MECRIPNDTVGGTPSDDAVRMVGRPIQRGDIEHIDVFEYRTAAGDRVDPRLPIPNLQMGECISRHRTGRWRAVDGSPIAGIVDLTRPLHIYILNNVVVTAAGVESYAGATCSCRSVQPPAIASARTCRTAGYSDVVVVAVEINLRTASRLANRGIKSGGPTGKTR